MPGLKPNIATSFLTDRPVAVFVVFLAAVVFGFFSYRRLPVTLMPDLNFPTLTVRTEYPGAAPEEVENDVSRPIEEALGVVGGLKKISSISRAGVSDVVLEFTWGTEMSEATQNTLEKLDLVFLPQDAERPLLLHFDPSLDPILELSLSGTGDRFEGESGLRRLRRLAELQIKRDLEPVEGIAAVRVRGGLEEEIHVLLDVDSLQRIQIPIQTVIDKLRQENINVAGGTLEEGRSEYMVRTLNEFTSLGQIADTVVKRTGDREVRIKDLGRVIRTQRDRDIVTKTQGRDSVQIDVYKEADANIVAVAKRIRDRIGSVAPPKPSPWEAIMKRGPRGPPAPQTLSAQLLRDEGARLELVADRSVFIKNSIRDVRNTAILGGLLAVLVLYIFLRNARTTVIIAVSIPLSLFITFAPMNLAGVSLNIMSLGGLALGVGMLVDSSIVVLESIFRCREEGDDLKPAALRGTGEVRAAVAASILTSVAVFFPMVFVEGIAGQAFGDLGMTVIISLLASLAVALFFIPMLASRAPATSMGARSDSVPAGSGSGSGSGSWKHWRSVDHFKDRSGRHGPRTRRALLPWHLVLLILGFALELTGRVLVLVFRGVGRAALVALIAPLRVAGRLVAAGPGQMVHRAMESIHRWYPAALRAALARPWVMVGLTAATIVATWQLGRTLDTELLPEVHQGEFTIEASLPVGTPVQQTRSRFEPVERRILQRTNLIQSVLVTYGYDIANMQRSDEGEHSARFKIVLDPAKSSPEIEESVIASLRELFVDLPEVNVQVVRPVLFSTRKPVVVEVQGDDLPKLRQLAVETQNVMNGTGAVTDVETTLKPGAPEIQVQYRRDQIARFGLNLQQIAFQVRNMVKGFEATRFNLKDRRIPIVVRLEESDRNFVDDIGALAVNPGGEKPIPLQAVADLKTGEGPSEIRRIDGERVALVEANIREGSLGSVASRLRDALSTRIDWPSGFAFQITGQNEEWEQSKGSLFLALGLSMFLVYVIMASQFESLIQPFVIMFTIPLAFLGTTLALHVLGISLSVVVVLGMIMLAGIVVNNAIVLVDYINILRGRGMPLQEAIVTAGTVRLRPIFMTTATTVLGLLPMAMGLGDGAEIRTPMAVAVIAGLITSTALTLFVIPTLYLFVSRATAGMVAGHLSDQDPETNMDRDRPARALSSGDAAPNS